MKSASRRTALFLGLTLLLASFEAGCTHGHGPTKSSDQEDILSSKATVPGNYSLFSSNKKVDRKILKRGKKSRYSSALDKGTR